MTGIARAIRGSTLIAGLGQQPVLEAFVDAPPGIGSPVVAFGLALAAPGGEMSPVPTQEVTEPTVDDGGTHYDFPWTTTGVAEGLYQARAVATFGDAGFQSNPAYVLVDRTPPSVNLTLTFDADAGIQPRDFDATATVVASDDGGSGEVGIGLAAEGVSWVEPAFGLSFRQVVRIDLPVEVPTVQGPTTTLQSQVSAASVPYDAWSTESDGWEITVLATATDLAGNTASAQVDVPVTRRLWQGGKLSTTGPVSLGAQGQILVNHGSSLDVLLPSGKLESSTAVDTSNGGPATGVGPPATLVSKDIPSGEVYVRSELSNTFNGASFELSSFGASGDGFTDYSGGEPPMALALSASRGLIYLMPSECSALPLDPLTGAWKIDDSTYLNPFPVICSGMRLAVGKDELVGSSTSVNLTYSLDPLRGDWSAPSAVPAAGASPAFLGDQALVNQDSQLELFVPSDAPALEEIDLAAPDPVNVVTSADGHIYVLTSNDILSKLDGSGTRVWSRKLSSGLKTTGLVVGKGGGLIYAVDGSGQLNAFDSAGLLRWSSPAGSVEGDPMVDRCTGHAYAGATAVVPMAMVLDSPGVDASPGSWPMGGHDVFQTYDSQATADVDCATHL